MIFVNTESNRVKLIQFANTELEKRDKLVNPPSSDRTYQPSSSKTRTTMFLLIFKIF